MPSELRNVRLASRGGEEMGIGAQPGSPVESRPRITIFPTTDLGWWAVWLAAAFFPLVFAAAVVPRGAALGFACALAGGVVALTAIVRHRERAVTVFAALAPVAVAVAFVLAELVGSL
jgi:hypothetical protein